jgi:hypothetical protein
MGWGHHYTQYVRRVNMRMRNIEDFDRAHKSTADLLREQQDEADAAAAAAAAEPTEPSEDAPVQGTKPHKAAQWDEKRACWVLWDKRRGQWVPYP